MSSDFLKLLIAILPFTDFFSIMQLKKGIKENIFINRQLEPSMLY